MFSIGCGLDSGLRRLGGFWRKDWVISKWNLRPHKPGRGALAAPDDSRDRLEPRDSAPARGAVAPGADRGSADDRQALAGPDGIEPASGVEDGRFPPEGYFRIPLNLTQAAGLMAGSLNSRLDAPVRPSPDSASGQDAEAGGASASSNSSRFLHSSPFSSSASPSSRFSSSPSSSSNESAARFRRVRGASGEPAAQGESAESAESAEPLERAGARPGGPRFSPRGESVVAAPGGSAGLSGPAADAASATSSRSDSQPEKDKTADRPRGFFSRLFGSSRAPAQSERPLPSLGMRSGRGSAEASGRLRPGFEGEPSVGADPLRRFGAEKRAAPDAAKTGAAKAAAAEPSGFRPAAPSEKPEAERLGRFAAPRFVRPGRLGAANETDRADERRDRVDGRPDSADGSDSASVSATASSPAFSRFANGADGANDGPRPRFGATPAAEERDDRLSLSVFPDPNDPAKTTTRPSARWEKPFEGSGLRREGKKPDGGLRRFGSQSPRNGGFAERSGKEPGGAGGLGLGGPGARTPQSREDARPAAGIGAASGLGPHPGADRGGANGGNGQTGQGRPQGPGPGVGAGAADSARPALSKERLDALRSLETVPLFGEESVGAHMRNAPLNDPKARKRGLADRAPFDPSSISFPPSAPAAGTAPARAAGSGHPDSEDQITDYLYGLKKTEGGVDHPGPSAPAVDGGEKAFAALNARPANHASGLEREEPGRPGPASASDRPGASNAPSVSSPSSFGSGPGRLGGGSWGGAPGLSADRPRFSPGSGESGRGGAAPGSDAGPKNLSANDPGRIGPPPAAAADAPSRMGFADVGNVHKSNLKLKPDRLDDDPADWAGFGRSSASDGAGLASGREGAAQRLPGRSPGAAAGPASTQSAIGPSPAAMGQKPPFSAHRGQAIQDGSNPARTPSGESQGAHRSGLDPAPFSSRSSPIPDAPLSKAPGSASARDAAAQSGLPAPGVFRSEGSEAESRPSGASGLIRPDRLGDGPLGGAQNSTASSALRPDSSPAPSFAAASPVSSANPAAAKGEAPFPSARERLSGIGSPRASGFSRLGPADSPAQALGLAGEPGDSGAPAPVSRPANALGDTPFGFARFMEASGDGAAGRIALGKDGGRGGESRLDLSSGPRPGFGADAGSGFAPVGPSGLGERRDSGVAAPASVRPGAPAFVNAAPLSAGVGGGAARKPGSAPERVSAPVVGFDRAGVAPRSPAAAVSHPPQPEDAGARAARSGFPVVRLGSDEAGLPMPANQNPSDEPARVEEGPVRAAAGSRLGARATPAPQGAGGRMAAPDGAASQAKGANGPLAPSWRPEARSRFERTHPDASSRAPSFAAPGAAAPFDGHDPHDSEVLSGRANARRMVSGMEPASGAGRPEPASVSPSPVAPASLSAFAETPGSKPGSSGSPGSPEPEAGRPLGGAEDRRLAPVSALAPASAAASAPTPISALRARFDSERESEARPAPRPYELPDLSLLHPPFERKPNAKRLDVDALSRVIEGKLAEYRAPGFVTGAVTGPVITRFEVEPGEGVRGSSIMNIQNDLARGMRMQSIRIVETVPGKTCMGVEVPNPEREGIALSEVLASDSFRGSPSPLTLALGKDVTGRCVSYDLKSAPHLLVAGTTGSGKSVGVNAMILSILFKATPEQVRFIMIDPKMLELNVYNGIPHLLAPVVTDMSIAPNALAWCVNEMDRRYSLMAGVQAKDLDHFNAFISAQEERGAAPPDPFSPDPTAPNRLGRLPFVVVVVDEFADLMMTSGKEIEPLIKRLVQKARAAGIHLILATQRPSVDLINGVIKANLPARVAYQVSSTQDSKTILGKSGAEKLLGKGDMLLKRADNAVLERVHGCLALDADIKRVADYARSFGAPQYVEEITSGTALDEPGSQSPRSASDERDGEAMYNKAVEFVVSTGKTSLNQLQIEFSIGYPRASKFMNRMEKEGIVSAPSLNGKRKVLLDAPPAGGDDSESGGE